MSNENKGINIQIKTNNDVIDALIKDPSPNSNQRIKELEQQNQNLRAELNSRKDD